MNLSQSKRSLFAFALSCCFLSGFSATSPSKKVTKKNLCDTWFVGQAWEIRQNGDKKDQSKKAKGSSFVFTQNNTFLLKDRAKSVRDTQEGRFSIFSKDSILLVFGSQKMMFQVSFPSKDSMTLSGNTYGRNLFIGLSRDSIAPYQRTEKESRRMYEEEIVSEYYDNPKIDQEIEIVEETIEEVVEETYEIPRKEPEYITREREKNIAEMKLIGQWKIEDSKKPFFTLSYNHFSISNQGEFELYGSWTLLNNLIKITNNKGTYSYKILYQTRTRIEISDLQKTKVFVLVK